VAIAAAVVVVCRARAAGVAAAVVVLIGWGAAAVTAAVVMLCGAGSSGYSRYTRCNLAFVYGGKQRL
jgi:hypothetical protein